MIFELLPTLPVTGFHYLQMQIPCYLSLQPPSVLLNPDILVPRRKTPTLCACRREIRMRRIRSHVSALEYNVPVESKEAEL